MRPDYDVGENLESFPCVEKMTGASGYVSEDVAKQIYATLERELPACSCGGRFRLNAYIKCPNCGYRFDYGGGHIAGRFFEEKIVWVERAIFYRGGSVPSNRLTKVHSSNSER